MIYKYNKYDSINSFINMFSSKNICNEYTILNKCNGFDFEKNKYTDNCFACLFCIFSNTLYKEFITDSQTKKNIELTEKICSLSEEKKVFITSVIDLLNDM